MENIIIIGAGPAVTAGNIEIKSRVKKLHQCGSNRILVCIGSIEQAFDSKIIAHLFCIHCFKGIQIDGQGFLR